MKPLLCALVLLLFTGCIHRKISIEPLQKECSALLAKYLPLFELPDSIGIYANCCCPEGAEAAATGYSFFFGLWKLYRVEIESEDAFYALSSDAREFVVCHELAHIKLNHLIFRYWWQSEPTFNRAESHQKEYDADALAVKVIGKSRGAIKYFGGILWWLLFGALMLLLPIFIPYGIIRFFDQKKPLWCIIKRWILWATGITLSFDLIVPLFSTHPACILRLLNAMMQAWY